MVKQVLSSIQDLKSSKVWAILTEDVKVLVENKLAEVIYYEPRIGIMGKSGAGKSSLANALVNKQVYQVGHTGGCTRELQEETVEINGHRMTFVDLPGISENPKRHTEYMAMYEKELPSLDIILWVVKVDDRANKDDQEFYQWLIQHYAKKQIIFVLTQADKANPTKGWDYETMEPSEKQKINIHENIARFQSDFGLDDNNIVSVAVDCDDETNVIKSYNLKELVHLLMENLPDEAKSPVIVHISSDNKTEEDKEKAKDGFQKFMSKAFDALIETQSFLPEPAKAALKSFTKFCAQNAQKLWSKCFD